MVTREIFFRTLDSPSVNYGSPEGTCTHFILIRSLELLIRGNGLNAKFHLRFFRSAFV